MPMYDFQCLDGHEFETVVRMANRADPIPCEHDGCELEASMLECSFKGRQCSTLLDYGFGLNREAVQKGTYDPLKPVQRGVKHRAGEKTPFG